MVSLNTYLYNTFDIVNLEETKKKKKIPALEECNINYEKKNQILYLRYVTEYWG